jgi:bacillithiol biosynthesis deacetylase BshB1
MTVSVDIGYADILAVGPHPDDVELTSAGTLIRMIDQGYSVGILDLTRGEMGTRGTPEGRAAEAMAAAEVIGARFRANLDLGDSRLTTSLENRMALASAIRRARPRTVILPYWEGRHPDHYTAATLGHEACYAAGLAQADLDGDPFRPHKILYSTIYHDAPPSFAVDVSATHARKIEAVHCYQSQFAGDMSAVVEVYPAWARLVDRVETQARYYGHKTGVEFAEPFVVKELMAVDDVVDMKVASI